MPRRSKEPSPPGTMPLAINNNHLRANKKGTCDREFVLEPVIYMKHTPGKLYIRFQPRKGYTQHDGSKYGHKSEIPGVPITGRKNVPVMYDPIEQACYVQVPEPELCVGCPFKKK